MVVGDVRKEDGVVWVVLLARKPDAPVLNLNAEHAGCIWMLEVVCGRVELVCNYPDSVSYGKPVNMLLIHPCLLGRMPVT